MTLRPASKCRLFFFLLILMLTLRPAVGEEVFVKPVWSLEAPALLIEGIPATLSIHCSDSSVPLPDTLWVNGTSYPATAKSGSAAVTVIPKAGEIFEIQTPQTILRTQNRAIPLWFSIIPPLIAILFALLFKEVFTALILGMLSGTFVMAWYGGLHIPAALGAGTLRIVDTYLVQTLTKPDHIAIMLFSMMIGGMVHVITVNGGMKGIVNQIARFASGRRSVLLSTWLMGIVVFFDDYANTLVVGNTMRPLTDRFGISREKLSYVVDSTAAPVAAVAFITTWIGAELSYIQSAVEVINSGTGPAIAEGPYHIFFRSLPWSFYPFLTLGFVGMVIWTRRDFGPMRQAEMGSGGLRDSLDSAAQPMTDAAEEIPELSSGITPRALNALIPVIAVIAGVCAGLVVTGIQTTGWDSQQAFGWNLSMVIGQADSFKALLWASFAGLTIAILLSVSQRLLSLRQATESMIKGFKTMLSAMMILVLAWSLAALTAELHTANFLANIMMQLQVAPHWLPVITFVLAALVSFSTGSSWGTMAILYPLLLPTSWQLFHDFQLSEPEAMRLFHAVVASVLAGSVLGDHCSPISDTTILSSLATGCDHIQHVRTQLPYALTVGVVTMVACIIPASFGLNPLISLVLGFLLLFVVLRLIGKKSLAP